VVKPPPAPPVKEPEVRKPEPVAPDPQIAIEKERKRLEKLEQEKEKKEREELKKQEIAEKKRLEQEKKEQERIEREEKKRLEALEKERQRQEAEAKERARQEAIKAAERAAERSAALQRISGLANASGGPTAVGTAQQSSGPSAGYGAKIRALLRPKIVFPDNLTGNPAAEVEVRTSPDGSVISRRIVRSSGVPGWDDAVLKAIDKTDRFPPDTDGDGKVPPQLVITFRPKDF
jgi:colicin import membrane protein